MKKKLLLLTLSMVVPIAAWCEDGDVFTAKTVENIEMTFKVISEADKTCQVGKGLGATVEPSISTEIVGHVTIPSEVNGYAVTTLAVNAFAGCTNLSSISVPNSVTAIGSSAFQNTQWYNDQPVGLVYAGNVAYKYKGTMPSGTTIELLNGTKGIAEECFRDYSNLKSITIPAGVTNIGELAFYGCTNLNTIDVPNSVAKIGRNAFYNTGWYNNQPNGLVYAGKVAYKYKGTAPAETSISIQDGTLSITRSAFSGCTGLVSVSFPTSLITIGESAFYGCKNLTSIDLPEGLKVIEHQAFAGCSGLSTITIPNSLTSIGTYAFSSCSSLMSVIIPDGVTSIRDYTFFECTNLSSVTIPNSVVSIGNNSFASCGLSTLLIPFGVQKIGPAAFHHCTMTSVTISSSLTILDEDVFTGCGSLETVVIYAPTLTLFGERAFDENASGRKIYVLSDKVATYKSGWGDYESCIAPIALSANDAGTSGKWCTYYNEGCNVTVADGTTIYKATLNGAKTQVTLTKIDGNIIKAGEAVVLNTTSANIELSSAASSGSGDYTDNDLKGGSTVADGTIAYTLGMVGGQLGFYQYSGSAPLDPYKAHLEIPATSAPSLIGISGTTDINNMENDKIEKDNKWYDLSGRELQGKPMQKGIYLKYGKKYIVK